MDDEFERNHSTSFEGPWEVIARLSKPWEAELARGRLYEAGFLVRLEGPNAGPYPLTVGSLAEIRLLVPSGDSRAARLFLDEIREEVQVSEGEDFDAASGGPSRRPVMRVLTGFVVLTLVTVALPHGVRLPALLIVLGIAVAALPGMRRERKH